ncbi:MAG: succinate dehydrogenase, hydrophobic membrane anchor protein [Woeseia sp.]
MSLRSPLGRVLGSGSAKDGTEHFWVQRLTAIALALLGCWFVVSLLQLDDFSRGVLLTWIAAPINSILLALLAITLAWHSLLGVQVVIEDYVHGPFIKVFALIMSKFGHLLAAAVAVYAVLKISFGGAV